MKSFVLLLAICFTYMPGIAFSEFRNVLLFVSKDSCGYIHEKYQYNNVYKTKNGRWAGTYHQYEVPTKGNCGKKIVPELIHFQSEVSFPTRMVDESGREFRPHYTEPYYKIAGEKAIADYGYYTEDLFLIKKCGVLAARGLFIDYDSGRAVVIQDVRLEDDPYLKYPKEYLKFISFWKKLSKSIAYSHKHRFRKSLLDSIWTRDSVFDAKQFMQNSFDTLFNPESIALMGDSAAVRYSWVEADSASLFRQAQELIVRNGRIFKFWVVNISKINQNGKPVMLGLYFIKTVKGYRFYMNDQVDD
jgi:hypothetical protein